MGQRAIWSWISRRRYHSVGHLVKHTTRDPRGPVTPAPDHRSVSEGRTMAPHGTLHMRPLPAVPLPRANRLKRFFWFCSGADMAILRTWDCSTEHNTYAGIGATIVLTAVLASLSGGYALWTVFQSAPSAITFGLLWGILIFNLDRYIVMSLHKSRGGFGALCRQVATASPRLLLALLIASVITLPLELKIFEREILDQLERNHQRTLNNDIQSLEPKYSEIADLEEQNHLLTAAITEKEGQRNDAFQEVQGEASGNRGTGIRGAGLVWRQKTAFLVQLNQELHDLHAQNTAQIQRNQARIGELKKARETEIAQKTVILHDANGLLARLEVLYDLLQEHTTTAIAFGLIAAMFVVIETAPVVVKLLATYGPYDAIVEHKEREVTLAAHKKMAEIPDKLQRESTHESARDDVVQHFVLQQLAQAIQRAERSPDFAALHETLAARLREEYREAMLRTLRRVFHPAVPDPEGMGAAGAAEASRRKARREHGRQAQTIHPRIETMKSFVTKKLRELMRRNGST